MGARGGGTGGGFVVKGFSPANLSIHYARHKNDFLDKRTGKTIAIRKYNEKAMKLLGSKIGGTVHGFTDTDGKVFRYNSEKNEFGICSPEGNIITFYRPTGKMKYWRSVENEYKSRTMPLLWQ